MSNTKKILCKESIDFLEKYLNNAAPTGYEVAGQKIWMDYLKPFVDDFITDSYGTAVGVINPDAPYKVVIEGHADEIAWYVNYITPEGLIYVIRNGGSDHQIAPSKMVDIHTEKGIVKGVFGWPAIHTRFKGGEKETAPKVDNLFIDVGCKTKEEVLELGIHVGSVITYPDKFTTLNERYFVCRALDNRMGGFMIAQVARLLKENKKELPFGLYIVNSVQEEIGLRGAEMITQTIKPNVAIVTDVCHDTTTPMIDKKTEGETVCGGGPVISYAPAIQHNVRELILNTAKEENITVQKLASSRMTANVEQQFITGTVNDTGGNPLPGVTVLVKGTQNAVQTDFDGNYRIKASNGDVLVFSYVGMTSKEVNVTKTNIDVTLQEETSSLDEVVVTALGIKREAKALGHSVTQVKGDELNKVIDVNPMNALQGKVAGVNITGNATGAAGSTRIVIRGNTSLTGNNQPLYVIDGIPMGNDNNGSAGMWGGSDGGDGISSLNPNEIASISVLKGAAAAALYGSRASGGVILITTKTGKGKSKGLGVEYSSTFFVDRVNTSLQDFQTTYGHGIKGRKPISKDEAFKNAFSSWGAKLDGSSAINWDGKERPYKYVGNNADKFYRTGTTLINSIAVSNANESMNYRLSATKTINKDVLPFSNVDRNMFGLNVGGSLGKKITVNASIKYNIERTNNRPRLSDTPGNANYSVLALPANVDVTSQKPGIGDDKKELRTNDNTYVQNPYWATEHFKNFDERHRVIASSSVRYGIYKGLYIFGRAGTDHYTRNATSIEPWGTAFNPRGQMNEQERNFTQTDMDLMLGYDGTIASNFAVKSLIGGSQNYIKREIINASGSEFIIPSLQDVKNTVNQSTGYGFSERAINGLYGSLELSYNEYAYLTVTARKDWFSTLSRKGKTSPNDQLYYSANTSFLVSEMIKMPDIINLVKIRGGYSQIAGGARDPYNLSLNYRIYGQGHQGQPLGEILGSNVPNQDLKPYLIDEVEFGLDVRLFQNRVRLDVAYYNKKTTNDIVNVAASKASGYSGSVANLGEITNKGYEILLNLRPIQTRDFTWDAIFNYTYNEGKVVKTNDEDSPISLGEARSRNVQIRHIPGEPYGVIWGRGYERNKDGKIIYELGNDGSVRAKVGKYKILGQGVAPINLGITNNFKYKRFSLSVVMDGKFGGQIYSGTNAGAIGRGQHKKTLEGRERDEARGKRLKKISGVYISNVDNDGDGEPDKELVGDEEKNITVERDFERTLDPKTEQLQNYWARESQIAEATVYDADFLRLRQIRLGASENIDPESGYNTGNAQGLEYYGVPSRRSYGLRFEEMNVNPTAAAQIGAKYKFTSLLLQTSGRRYESWRANLIYQSTMVQHLAATATYWSGDKYFRRFDYAASLFDAYYPSAVKNVQDIIQQLVKEENPDEMLAIAKIMRVVIFQRLTDLYGDIPYSEAGKGFMGILKPKYDKQSDIYPAMLKDLEDAGKVLSAASGTSAYGDADIMFKGDLGKWKRYCYSMMLRLGMRLSKVDPAMAVNWTTKAIAGGVMTSNADIAYIQHTNGPEGINKNGNGEVFTADNNARMSKTFIDALQGDPRLTVLASLPEKDKDKKTRTKAQRLDPTKQKGLPNGTDSEKLKSDYGDDMMQFSEPNRLLITGEDAPMFFQTYAEVCFMLAEIATLKGDSAKAKTEYDKGVTAAMKQLSIYGDGGNISDADITKYLTTTKPYDDSKGEEMINTQYWIVTFLNEYESFSNWRRTGFPNLTPVKYPGNMTEGTIPRRLLYPVSEQTENKENYDAATNGNKENTLTKRVWWDKE
uniref:TonB-dependent receptor SusC n=1 Tax=Stylophora pistillata TaxID=50429 RepID=A0A2B4RVH3_STYPI